MISPHHRGRALGPGLSAKDKARLWIFAGLFVLVLAIFLGSLIYGQKEEAGLSSDIGGYGGSRSPIDIAASRDETGRPKFTYQPQTPREKRDLAQDEQQARLLEFFRKGELRDAEEGDAEEVLTYLVERSLNEWRVTGVPESLYVRLPEEKVLFEPGPYRGTFASAFGQVVADPVEIPFAGHVDQVTKLYRVLFRTAEGEIYEATQTVPIERKAGDWMQVYGIFYRTRPVEAAKPGRAALCLVLVKEIRDAYPPLTVTEIDPAWASEVREATFEEANETDERPFWLLLNYVRNLGIDGYRRLRDAGKIRVEEVAREGTLARDLSRLPEEYRFHFVAALGKVIDPYPDFLQKDNPGKIRRVDSAVLLQPTQYFVRLVSPRPWSEFDFRLGQDYVRVEGIFYKRWMYVPTAGGPAREIPLLVVTDIVPVDRGRGEILPLLQWVFAALAVGLVVFFLAVAFRDRRRLAEFRSRMRERQGERGPPGDGE